MRCLFLLLLPAALVAQTGASRITGTITDVSGAVVPGATVTARNDATAIAYTQNTTDTGFYAFPALPAGSYTVSATAKGFRTAQRSGIVLEINSPIDVDLSLEVGASSELVTVAATAELLQTTNASIGNVVEQKAIVDLPLNGRNPLNLIVLEPGVVQRSNGGAGSGVHVNGSRDRAFNVTIDGIEANESSVPNPLSNLYRLNPDMLQEYRVVTNNATAEEGRNSGASVSIATRAGTNEFHGTAFEFFRNTALNANDWFANAQGTPKPPIHLNQYGFEIGGPVRKNRTFFFGSWQGQKISFEQPIDQSFGAVPNVYTATALAGIYRYFRPDPGSPLVIEGQRITRNTPLLVDPYTGAYRPGVRDCASPNDLNCVASYHMFANDPRRLGADATIARLFAAYPRPNSWATGDGLNTAAYLWNPPTRYEGPSWMARIDHTFDSNNTLFVRWLQSNYDTRQGDPNNSRPMVFPGWPPLGEVFRSTKNLAVSYRRVISPRVVNEFTAGFGRFVFLFTQGEANPSFPDIPPYIFNNVDVPFRNTPRTFRAVTTPQVLDNLSVVTGSHVLRMGFNIRLYQHNDQRGQPGGINVTPQLRFDYSLRPPAGFSMPPGIDATDQNRLQGSINDLLGIPARLSQVFLGDLGSDAFLPFRTGDAVTMWARGHRQKQFNFYAQDEWRVRRNFTLNYGVRWEINLAPTEAAGRVLAPDKPLVGSQGLVGFRQAERWYQRNNLGALAPRFGFTWSPGNSQKTVIRSGYGIAFDPVASFQVTAVAGKVPGLTTSCSSTVGGATTQGCQPAPDVRIAEGFPMELRPPTTKPSSFLTPPLQLYANSPALTVFDQQMKLPTVHQWNLNVQRELPGGVVAQLGYIGRRGTRLLRAYDLNQIDSDPILPSFLAMQRNLGRGCRPDGSNCPAGSGGETVPLVASGVASAAFVNSSTTISDLRLNGAGNFAGRLEQATLAARLRPNQQFSSITYIDSGGDSYYHSAQATARKRFGQGFMMTFAYTFGKSIDNQSTDPVGATSGGGIAQSSGLPNSTTSRAPIDIRNWRLERARSDYDRTHVLATGFVWELPIGRNKAFGANLPAALNHIVGGWGMNGIYSFMSGEPFSVRSGVRTANYSHESRAAIKPGRRPVAQLQEAAGVIGPVVFPNADDFELPAPGELGAGRNLFEAPGFWNLDLSLTKRFDLGERARLQFRAEMFNVLNHPNFDNPRDASVGSPSFRSTLFAQTCCAVVAPASTQNIIQTGEAMRVIQLVLRVQW